MDKSEIENLIQQGIKDYMERSQYGVTKIPSHLHNGMDTNKIDFFSLTNRPLVGTLDSTGKGWLLPPGWTSVKTGTGIYVITHKLNSPIQSSGFYPYNVFISHLGSGSANMFDVTYSSNYFTVTFFNVTGTPTDSNFNFSLSLIK